MLGLPSRTSRILDAKNGDTIDAPAFAVVAITASDPLSGDFTFAQPVEDGQAAWINAPSPIIAGDSGVITADFPAWAYYETADGVPSIGEIWGAGAHTWKLRKGNSGFRICGTPNTDFQIVQVERVERDPIISSADCSSWLGRIKAAICASLSIAPPSTGACACVPSVSGMPLAFDSATGTLTTSADTPLYGCPPGVVATDCPNGGPLKWVITASGFTGPDAAKINLTWTLTYDSGSGTWKQTQGTVTGTLTTSGSSATLTFVDGSTTIATYTISGFTCCADNSFALGSVDGTELTDGPASLDVQVATGCGIGPAWQAILDECVNACGEKHLRMRWVEIASGSSGGSAGVDRTVTWTPAGCGQDANGNDTMDFATDDPLICGAKPADGCGDNSIKVRVTCHDCSDTTCPQCPDGMASTWTSEISGFSTDGAFNPNQKQFFSEGSDLSCFFGNSGGGSADPIKIQHDAANSQWTLTVDDFHGKLATYTIADADFTCCGTNAFTLASSTWTTSPGTITVKSGEDCESFFKKVDCGGTPTVVPDVLVLGVTLTAGSDVYGIVGNHTVTKQGGCGNALCPFCWNGSVPGPAAIIPLSAVCVGTSIANSGYNAWFGSFGPSAGFSWCDVFNGGPSYPVALTDGTNTYSITITAGTATTYNCLDSGGCIDPGDGTGRYTDLGDCLADCASSPPPPAPPGCAACDLSGLTPTLVVPDGPNAGTYTGTAWGGVGDAISAEFLGLPTFGVGSFQIACFVAGPNVGVFESSSGTPGTVSSCGPPAVFTLPGSLVGASGDLTITT